MQLFKKEQRKHISPWVTSFSNWLQASIAVCKLVAAAIAHQCWPLSSLGLWLQFCSCCGFHSSVGPSTIETFWELAMLLIRDLWNIKSEPISYLQLWFVLNAERIMDQVVSTYAMGYLKDVNIHGEKWSAKWCNINERPV